MMLKRKQVDILVYCYQQTLPLQISSFASPASPVDMTMFIHLPHYGESKPGSPGCKEHSCSQSNRGSMGITRCTKYLEITHNHTSAHLCTVTPYALHLHNSHGTVAWALQVQEHLKGLHHPNAEPYIQTYAHDVKWLQQAAQGCALLCSLQWSQVSAATVRTHTLVPLT